MDIIDVRRLGASPERQKSAGARSCRGWDGDVQRPGNLHGAPAEDSDGDLRGDERLL